MEQKTVYELGHIHNQLKEIEWKADQEMGSDFFELELVNKLHQINNLLGDLLLNPLVNNSVCR